MSGKHWQTKMYLHSKFSLMSNCSNEIFFLRRSIGPRFFSRGFAAAAEAWFDSEKRYPWHRTWGLADINLASCRIQGQATNICHLPPLGANFAAPLPQGLIAMMMIFFPWGYDPDQQAKPFLQASENLFPSFPQHQGLFVFLVSSRICMVVPMKASSAVSAFLGHFLDNIYTIS